MRAWSLKEEKMENKTKNILFWSVLVVLLLVTAYNFIRSQKVIKTVQNDYEAFRQAQIAEWDLAGKTLDYTSFQGLDKKEPFSARGKERYTLLFIFPQLICEQCVYAYDNILRTLEGTYVRITVLGLNREVMKGLQKKYELDYPVYYTDSAEWFESKKMIEGPLLILLDGRTGIVLRVSPAFSFLEEPEKEFAELIKVLDE
jgi:hypothetical protein